MEATLKLKDYPPQDIIEAARKIHLYFAKLGIKTWELDNLCSRNHAHLLRDMGNTLERFWEY